MPEVIVRFQEVRLKVEEEHEDVRGQETHSKHQDEHQDCYRYFLPCSDLIYKYII